MNATRTPKPGLRSSQLMRREFIYANRLQLNHKTLITQVICVRVKTNRSCRSSA